MVEEDINKAVSDVTHSIIHAANICIPKSSGLLKRHSKPWLNKECKVAKNSNRKHGESSVGIQTPEITLHLKRREQKLGKYGINVSGSHGLGMCQASPLIQAAKNSGKKIKKSNGHPHRLQRFFFEK